MIAHDASHEAHEVGWFDFHSFDGGSYELVLHKRSRVLQSSQLGCTASPRQDGLLDALLRRCSCYTLVDRNSASV